MKTPMLLLMAALSWLASCKGQHTAQSNNAGSGARTILKGEVVKELGNNIMVVYQDAKGHYWFGSWESGLYNYDGKTLLHFTTKDGLPHNRVEEIKEDKLGNIFVNTSEGLCKFDGNEFTKIQETTVFGDGWALGQEDLWFKCPPYLGQVYRYDGNALYRLKLPETPLGREYEAKHSGAISPYGVYCTYRDRKGNVWFGTAILGTCRYNGETFDWIHEEDVTELHNGPSNGVRSIAEDQDGHFWFNTAYRYDVYGAVKPGPVFYNRIKGIGSLDGKIDGDMNEYLSIVADSNGAMWIATYNGGVWKCDGEKITHYEVLSLGKQINLFYIYKDRNGELWLGSHSNGAFKFNGQAFETFKP